MRSKSSIGLGGISVRVGDAIRHRREIRLANPEAAAPLAAGNRGGLKTPSSHGTATLELGLIGNCQVASLIDANGSHVWTCMPRLDGDPAFCELLGGSDELPTRYGRWAIELLDQVEQHGRPTSAIPRSSRPR